MNHTYSPETLQSMQELAKVVDSWLSQPKRLVILNQLVQILSQPGAELVVIEGNSRININHESTACVVKAMHFILGLMQTSRRMSEDAGLFHKEEQVDPKNN